MDWPSDGLASFFLICFLIGLFYTVAAFLLGFGHGGGLAGEAGHGGDGDHSLGHHDIGVHGSHGGHGGPAGHGGDHAPSHGQATGQQSQSTPTPDAASGTPHSHGPSPLNLPTIMAFLTWFGGAGYILRTYSTTLLLVTLLGAVVIGLIGAALVFLFLSRVLVASERVLDPRDYYLPGTLARVTSSIRAGGTGEVVFSKGDSRQVAGARSVHGEPIERGTEVVILRYERGLAYVQRWDELMSEEPGGGRPPPAGQPS